MRIDALKPNPAPLAEGQEVASVGNHQVPRETASRKSIHNTFPLALGQELEAVIVDELDGGQVLLKIGSSLIEADSPGGISQGQHVRLRVEQLQPQVVLQITEVEPTLEAEASRLLRSHMPVNTDFGELLDSLQSQLTGLSKDAGAAATSGDSLAKLRLAVALLLASGTPPDPERLAILARDGGLFYEAKLFDAVAKHAAPSPEVVNGDLKGLLLAALQETQVRAFSHGLRSALRAQLENVETQQAINLLAQLDGGAFQLQIPFFTGAGFSTAALAVEADGDRRDGKPKKEGAGYALLFLLDLENFGRTRIDAHINETELCAIFYVDNVESLELIQRELPSFRDSLLSLGYHDVSLAGKALGEMPQERKEKFLALAAGAPSSSQLLDMKA